MELPSTLAFDYPTASALTDFIFKQIQPITHMATLAKNVDSSLENSHPRGYALELSSSAILP